MLMDLRYALRRLARAPAFSITVMLLLGMALGANACVFSVIYGLAYKPLSIPDADRLVALDDRFDKMRMDVGLSVPLLEDIQQHARTLENVAGYRERQIASGGASKEVATYQVAIVQPALFTLLQARPALGRLFGEEDAQTGAAHSAVIAWDLWQGRFGGSADVLDRTLALADGEHRIVGVLPKEFGFPRPSTQVWLPLGFSAAERGADHAGSFGDLHAIGRLREPMAAASTELGTLSRNLDGLKDIIDLVGFRPQIKPLRDLWIGERRAALDLMLLAVALVLIVAVANICNLYIARQLSRRQELALQAALGAGGWRRLRQALAEALALAGGAALIGIAIVPLGLLLLRRFDVVPADTLQVIGLDTTTLVFILAVAAIVAAAMACSALWLQRHNLALAVRAGGTRQTASREAQFTRQTLIVAQIGVTAALLVGVGLLLRSSQRLLAEEVGFERDGLVITSMADLPRSEAGAAPTEQAIAAARAALRTFVERAHGLPGVSAVGLGSVAPFGWGMSVSNFELPGEGSGAPRRTANRAMVNAEYFGALGVPIRRGRDFSAEEAASEAPVAIVDEEFVRRAFADTDPLGRRISVAHDDNAALRELTVIGVVATLKLQSLDETPDQPTVYQPTQFPLNGMILVRTGSEASNLVAPLTAAFHEAAPGARLREVLPMRERIAQSLSDRQRLNTLLELLGGMALALAGIGLYAVLAYTVRLRTTEFGVRMALGASGATVRWHVLERGMRLIGYGLALAMPLAYAVATSLRSRLFRVEVVDPTTWMAVAALLGAIGLLACWLPARRAASVDPIRALRDE